MSILICIGEILIALILISVTNVYCPLFIFPNFFSKKRVIFIIKAFHSRKKNNIILKNGDIYTSDVFYADTNYEALRDKYNVVGVEMETFGLLQEARITGKKATAIFTISNSFVNNRELSSSEREKNLDKMITLALETSLNL